MRVLLDGRRGGRSRVGRARDLELKLEGDASWVRRELADLGERGKSGRGGDVERKTKGSNSRRNPTSPPLSESRASQQLSRREEGTMPD